MTTWQSGYVQSDDVQIHYQRKGQGMPLILAHGFSDSGECWKAMAERFVANYDIILIDARGHGKSGYSAKGHGNVHQAKDLAVLIDTLQLHRPFVMGHSMGANTTLQLAVDRPESVRGIVLEDPAFFMNQVPDSPSRVDEIRRNMHAWIHEMQAMPFEQVVMRCIKDNPTWRAEELIAWAESKRQFGEKMEHFGPAKANPWQELIPQLRVPALLVTSDPTKGGLVTAEAAATARALSPHVEVALIRRVGHCIRREAPAAFEKLVATYFQRIATR